MPRAKSTVYVSKAVTHTIKASSRASVKVRDNYFTVEYEEERIIPEIEGIDLNKERELLWDKVNDECDKQVDLIYKLSKKGS